MGYCASAMVNFHGMTIIGTSWYNIQPIAASL